MLPNDIHPRFRERISKIDELREHEILDSQVRIYCQLSKAANRLRQPHVESMDWADSPGSDFDEKKAEAICLGAARAMREQALGASTSGAKLTAIYADLERLSESISLALAGGRTP